jgi:hypothetical protein
MFGEIGALTGTAFWLVSASWFKMPVSATQSIVGATVAFSLVLKGFTGIDWWQFAFIRKPLKHSLGAYIKFACSHLLDGLTDHGRLYIHHILLHRTLLCIRTKRSNGSEHAFPTLGIHVHLRRQLVHCVLSRLKVYVCSSTCVPHVVVQFCIWTVSMRGRLSCSASALAPSLA